MQLNKLLDCWVSDNSMKRNSIKKNAVYNAVKTISAIIFPLITFPYISRVLMPDNVGKIYFGLSIVSYFTLIAGLGMSTYAIRECAIHRTDKQELSRISSELFSINIVTTLVSYILLIISFLLFRQLDNYRLLIIIQSTTILFTTLSADWLNSAMEDFRIITIRTVGFQVLSIILMIIFVRQPDDYYKYALISVVSSSGASFVNIWYRRRYCSVKFTFHMNFKKHIGPILAFFAMVLSTTIFANADTTMLGLMCGDYQVGVYNTAHKINNIVAQLIQSLNIVMIPRLSAYFGNDDYESANKLLRKLLCFNITFGLPCVVGVMMCAPDAVCVIAGEEYAEAGSVMRIMILSFAFSLVGGSFLGNAILLPTRREKYYMVVCLITAGCNIVLNAIFIPIFQSNAAAATTAFNGFLIFLLLSFKVDKRIHIEKMWKVFFSPVIGCIAIVIICLLFRFVESTVLRLILSVSVSAAVYGVLMLILKNDIIFEVFTLIKNKFFSNKKKGEG